MYWYNWGYPSYCCSNNNNNNEFSWIWIIIIVFILLFLFRGNEYNNHNC